MLSPMQQKDDVPKSWSTLSTADMMEFDMMDDDSSSSESDFRQYEDDDDSVFFEEEGNGMIIDNAKGGEEEEEEPHVRFGCVEIHEHEIELSDMVIPKAGGAPLGISWHRQRYQYMSSVDEYEALRPTMVRHGCDLYIPQSQRMERLLRCGYEISEIRRQSCECVRIRTLRKQSASDKVLLPRYGHGEDDDGDCNCERSTFRRRTRSMLGRLFASYSITTKKQLRNRLSLKRTSKRGTAHPPSPKKVCSSLLTY